jgi:hypothetical protein
MCYQHDIIGRAMAQAVSRRPLTSENRVCFRVIPWRICGGQSGIGAGICPSFSEVLFHRASLPSYII